MKIINWPLDKAGNLILATPGLGDVIKKSVQGLISYCGDLAHWSVQTEMIFDEFRKAGHAEIKKIAEEVAKKRTWKQLEEHAFVQVIQQIAKALGIRLTKAKLAQILPAAGAAVGGGFNAYFTSKVCDAAYYLYRERFLAAKYGAEVIEVTVEPAEDIDPHYPEEGESIP